MVGSYRMTLKSLPAYIILTMMLSELGWYAFRVRMVCRLEIVDHLTQFVKSCEDITRLDTWNFKFNYQTIYLLFKVGHTISAIDMKQKYYFFCFSLKFTMYLVHMCCSYALHLICYLQNVYSLKSFSSFHGYLQGNLVIHRNTSVRALFVVFDFI